MRTANTPIERLNAWLRRPLIAALLGVLSAGGFALFGFAAVTYVVALGMAAMAVGGLNDENSGIAYGAGLILGFACISLGAGWFR